MSQHFDDPDVAKLQEIMPTASPESLRNFVACVKSNEHLKTTLPFGVIGGLVTYAALPSKIGIMRSPIAYVAGFTVFLIAKIKHMKVCYNNAFGVGTLPGGQDRMPVNTAPSFGRKIDQQEPKIYSAESADSFVQESPISSNYDLPFENASKEFNDPSDYFKEEEPSEKQNVEGKRVTYEDLWMQHRKKQMEDQYRDLMGYTANISKEAETTQRIPMEEPIVSDAEYQTSSVWR